MVLRVGYAETRMRKNKLPSSVLVAGLGVLFVIGISLGIGLLFQTNTAKQLNETPPLEKITDSKKDTPRELETYALNPAYTAFYELEATPTVGLNGGDLVTVSVYLTTSGPRFETAIAAVDWDSTIFEYINSDNPARLDGEFLSVTNEPETGKRRLIMTHYYKSNPDYTLYQLQSGARTLFAQFQLQVRAGGPGVSRTSIQFGEPLDIKFCSGGTTTTTTCTRYLDGPRIDQTQAQSGKTSVWLTQCGANSKRCTANNLETCAADGSQWSSQVCGANAYCNPSSFACTTYSCTGTNPTNATLCTGDNQSLIANAANQMVGTCSSGTKCEYTCNSGYGLVNGACVAFACTGNIPANATLCTGDNQSLTANAANQIVSTCNSGTKCEYTCNSNYALVNGACVARVCTANTEKRCSTSGVPQTCNSTGTAWINATACVSGTQCTDLGVCTAIPGWCNTSTDCSNQTHECANHTCTQKTCTVPANTCQTVSVINHECQTQNVANGTTCETSKICQAGSCVNAYCPLDIDKNYQYGVVDLLDVLNHWGQANGVGGFIGFDELMEVLVGWGPCPK